MAARTTFNAIRRAGWLAAACAPHLMRGLAQTCSAQTAVSRVRRPSVLRSKAGLVAQPRRLSTPCARPAASAHAPALVSGQVDADGANGRHAAATSSKDAAVETEVVLRLVAVLEQVAPGLCHRCAHD